MILIVKCIDGFGVGCMVYHIMSCKFIYADCHSKDAREEHMSISDKLSPVAMNFTLKDHTYDVLRKAILEMNIYQPETDLRLDERTLAENLAISRTPIREALARLAQDGLVEIIPRKGVFVHRKSLEEILEMIVIWAALESMAARLATEKASDDDLRALRKFAMKNSMDAMSAEIEEYSEANIKFHQYILDLSGCKALGKMADGLFVHMHAIRRRAMGESDRVTKSVADHMEIIEALESRDADLASKRVREHTMRLHDHIHTTWTRLDNIDSEKTI
jgi:DNA-binding GntR family transcriptional regulator